MVVIVFFFFLMKNVVNLFEIRTGKKPGKLSGFEEIELFFTYLGIYNQFSWGSVLFPFSSL